MRDRFERVLVLDEKLLMALQDQLHKQEPVVEAAQKLVAVWKSEANGWNSNKKERALVSAVEDYEEAMNEHI